MAEWSSAPAFVRSQRFQARLGFETASEIDMRGAPGIASHTEIFFMPSFCRVLETL